MITGDHDRTDAGSLGSCNGSCRFLSGRIYHRDQAQEGIAILRMDVEIFIRFLVSKRQYTQAIFRKKLILHTDLVFFSFRHRTDIVTAAHIVTAV